MTISVLFLQKVKIISGIISMIAFAKIKRISRAISVMFLEEVKRISGFISMIVFANGQKNLMVHFYDRFCKKLK